MENVKTFLNKHPEIQGSSKHYAKAMLLAGASEEEALKSVLPLQKTSGGVIDLTCPSCNGLMQQVSLKDERKAIYCSRDRVCLPIPN
jgi:hypothetical protein